jgi:hypothetical protein
MITMVSTPLFLALMGLGSLLVAGASYLITAVQHLVEARPAPQA